MKIVFVHGRNQQGKDPALLHEEWRKALEDGFASAGLSWPTGVESVLPFYGDRLDALITELDAPLIGDVIERGESNTDDEAAFRGELLKEIAWGNDISDTDIQAAIRDEGKPQVVDRGPGNWEWVQWVVRLIDRKTKIGTDVLDRFTRDVYVYLTNDGVREEMEALIRDAIPDEKCVVVAHSLGTVIAYNVLRDLKGARSGFITVGSPLGIQAIKRKLKVPLKMPDRASHWYNAMDERDFVALYPLTKNNFGVTPEIENNTAVHNLTGEGHGIVGYLSDPAVARAIYTALT